MSRGVGGERGRGRGAGRSSVGRGRGRGGRGATYYRNSDYNEFHDYRPRQRLVKLLHLIEYKSFKNIFNSSFPC